MKEKFISIIVPFKNLDEMVKECVGKCLKLDYKNFEIILLPDENIKFKKVKIIPTGNVKPSVKRNIGVSKAKGEIIAFIDSDAYPEKDWLVKAVKYLDDADVGIVGGPNLTPEEDSELQKASGEILSSSIMVGKFSQRYKKKKEGNVKELPSCNLFIRKKLYEKIGGFDVNLLTAEDAKLCFMCSNLGKKVYYAPDVFVYHHRRPLFKKHLKQLFIYGRDKAVLLKKGVGWSVYYFIPSLFVLYVIFGFILSLVFGLFNFYIYSLLLYLLIMILASLSISIRRFYLIFLGGILTHFAYGIGFLKGLFKGS